MVPTSPTFIDRSEGDPYHPQNSRRFEQLANCTYWLVSLSNLAHEGGLSPPPEVEKFGTDTARRGRQPSFRLISTHPTI